MGTLFAVLGVIGGLLAAAGTWLSAGWLILAGGMTMLISALAVPSTRAVPARRTAPHSPGHDLPRDPDGARAPHTCHGIERHPYRDCRPGGLA